MKKIESLTPIQSNALAPQREKWLTFGLDTSPINQNKARAAISLAYECTGLTPPSIFIWLESPMRGVYGAHFLAQVGAQVWAQVGAQVWDQVRAQVWDQVWDQVGDQVWDQVLVQVEDKVWDQVGSQVRYQTWDQVGNQVWDQVEDKVWDQIRSDQIRSGIRSGIG